MGVHIRIALLVCDTPIPAVLAAHGDYTAIFTRLLSNSLPPARRGDMTLDAFDVVHKMEYPPEGGEYDAFLITGSAASAYENVEWINKLVAYTADLAAHKPNVKIFGICFGHQMVSRALGAECVPNGGKWEAGTTTIALTEVGKEVFGDRDVLNIQQMHRDHVPTVPPECQLLASTDITYNQGYVRYVDKAARDLRGIQILTLQGHPEFAAPLTDIIIDARAAVGVMAQDFAAEAKARNTRLTNDGVDVGRVIWKVLGIEG